MLQANRELKAEEAGSLFPAIAQGRKWNHRLLSDVQNLVPTRGLCHPTRVFLRLQAHHSAAPAVTDLDRIALALYASSPLMPSKTLGVEAHVTALAHDRPSSETAKGQV